MKHHLLVVLGSIGFSTISFSQEASPTVVSAGGGTAKGNAISLDWTLGEIATETIQSAKALYTQGFHQPALIVEKITEAGVPIVKNNISVFPNPVTSVLNIRLHFIPQTALSVSLWDGRGKLLINKKMPAQSETLQLNVSSYAQGAYYLQIRNRDGSILTNYNIIKTQ